MPTSPLPEADYPGAVQAWHTPSVKTAIPRTSIDLRVLIVAAVAAVLDWVTKVVAATTLEDGPVEIGSQLTLRLSRNPGVAFGFGDWLPGPALLAVTGAVTIAIGVLAARSALTPWWAAGMVLGGAVANLLDRALGGTVVDFLDLGWWPSFNLADVWLTVGCTLMVLASLREPRPAP